MLITSRTSELGALGLKGADMVPVMVRVMLTYPQGWIRAFLPIHFLKRAYARYGYTPRQGDPGSGRRFAGSYQGNKLLRFGRTLPLVYTGRGRAEALSSRRATATRRRASAIVPARVYNLRNPASRVDMRKELTTVAAVEQAQLNADAQRKTDAEINRLAARY
ncbi:MAG: hypothetical protein AAF805_00100 [Planctomycetota bacterium]